jgi:hypothetical protein
VYQVRCPTVGFRARDPDRPEENEEDKFEAGSTAKATVQEFGWEEGPQECWNGSPGVCEWCNQRHSLKRKLLSPWSHKRLGSLPLSISNVQIHLDALKHILLRHM